MYLKYSKFQKHSNDTVHEMARDEALLGTFISNLVLTLLCYSSASEFNLIHQRQAEGIAAAKARGVKMGRPPQPLPENFYEVYQAWREGKITATEAASRCDMPVSSFKYRAKNYQLGTQSEEGGSDNK